MYFIITLFGKTAAQYDVANKTDLIFRLTVHNALGSRFGEVIASSRKTLKPIKC
jgi:hypothetical protein